MRDARHGGKDGTSGPIFGRSAGGTASVSLSEFCADQPDLNGRIGSSPGTISMTADALISKMRGQIAAPKLREHRMDDFNVAHSCACASRSSGCLVRQSLPTAQKNPRPERGMQTPFGINPAVESG
jgi:hypothetical protein